jgi:hypothetical protein
MQPWQTSLLLAAAVLAAGSYALMRDAPAPDVPRVVETPRAAPFEPEGDLQERDPTDEDDPMEAPGSMQDPAPDDEPPAIEWSIPQGWRAEPNPSSMRIATYAVPRVTGDPADADVSVTRAGGDVSSNVARWVEQFEGASEPKRTTRKVHGLDVTVVEIEGAYASAMHPGSKPRARWALLGAIVSSRGQPYFFKMTGPAATVHAARGAFTTLVESIRPAK